MANLNPIAELSSDDILRRILQKTEDTMEEVEANHKQCLERVETNHKKSLETVESNHKKSLERMPNSECNVCFEDFSALKRKRACFDPCGHTGTCIDCGNREWKRTKRCPLCKSGSIKPVAVSSKLFFG